MWSGLLASHVCLTSTVSVKEDSQVGLFREIFSEAIFQTAQHRIAPGGRINARPYFHREYGCAAFSVKIGHGTKYCPVFVHQVSIRRKLDPVNSEGLMLSRCTFC